MTLATAFAPLLAFLAAQTAQEARSSTADDLSFDVPLGPGVHTGFMDRPEDVGADVVSRLCCALKTDRGVDPAAIGTDEFTRHEYRPRSLQGSFAGGGGVGYVYTRRGGFIDLGHVRDIADYARFFANRFFFDSRQGLADGSPGSVLPGSLQSGGSEGDVRLIIAPRAAPIDLRLCAMVGARLAYHRALWHEIFTYDGAQDFSAFAPEDNFSNAVGALVGTRAVLVGDVDQRTAVDNELTRVLEALGPASKDVTNEAIDYVSGFWFSLFGMKRRHFDAVLTPRPWLVTDIAIPGEEAAGEELRRALGSPQPVSISIPSHYNGLELDALARLEIASPSAALKTTMGPLPHPGRLRSADFPTLVAKLRAKWVADHPDGDSPGPPVP